MPFCPRVSTVITSYNKGAFLAEAIESALAQDYVPHDIIVVDDGSTDDTRQVAMAFGDRIRFIHQETGGQSNAKNRGIRESRGEFIAFLDGDDRWRDGKLRKQVPLFQGRPRVGVVYSPSRWFSQRSAEAAETCLPPVRRYRRGAVLEAILVDNFVPFSSALVRRSALDRAGWFDDACRIAPDYELWLRLAREYEFDYVDEVLLDYWVGGNRIGEQHGTKFEHVMKIQEGFLARYYPAGFPNPAAVGAATAQKYAEHADWLLAAGQQLAALRAYLAAARWQPAKTRYYQGICRALVPNGVVGIVKRRLSKGQQLRRILNENGVT